MRPEKFTFSSSIASTASHPTRKKRTRKKNTFFSPADNNSETRYRPHVSHQRNRLRKPYQSHSVMFILLPHRQTFKHNFSDLFIATLIPSPRLEIKVVANACKYWLKCLRLLLLSGCAQRDKRDSLSHTISKKVTTGKRDRGRGCSLFRKDVDFPPSHPLVGNIERTSPPSFTRRS